MPDTFDENGEHFLNKFRKQPHTKITIDFFEEKVRVYVVLPQNSTNSNLLNKNGQELILSKNFKITEDFEEVIIDDVHFWIPSFFNKDLLKQEDTKTWEMVFYYIFSNTIAVALEKYKVQKKEINTEEN